jgi:hypothetical protein
MMAPATSEYTDSNPEIHMTVMFVLLIALVVANLVVLAVVLATQRVTAPVCGACGAGLAPTLDRNCESCGEDLIQRGIAAGAVMRPTPRPVLMLLMVVVVLSLAPFLAKLAMIQMDSMEQNGPWMSTRTVVFATVRDDVQKVRVVVSARFPGPFLIRGVPERIDLTVSTEDDSVAPLRILLAQDGSEFVSPAHERIRKWFRDARIDVDQASIDGVAEQITSIATSSSFSSVGMFSSASGSYNTEVVGLSPWIVAGLWSAVVASIAVLLVIGGIFVTAGTRARAQS